MSLPKRIIKETERLAVEPVDGISAIPHDDNLRYFDVEICGPTQTPFEGGKFKLELFLPESYPMEPPKANDVAEHWKVDEQAAIATAKEWTVKHAI